MTLITLAWVFFRADSAGQAVTVIRSMFPVDVSGVLSWGGSPAILGVRTFLFHLGLVLLLVGVELVGKPGTVQARVTRWALPARWSLYAVGAWAIAISTVFGVHQEFIYFQF
jgi:hypothetical protein